jgi:hypothetical protein
MKQALPGGGVVMGVATFEGIVEHGQIRLKEKEDQMTLAELIESSYALAEQIKQYEKKYGITSADFYQLFIQGKLDDGEYEQTEEYCEWAGLYEIKLKREQQFRELSQQAVSRLVAENEGQSIQLAPLGELVEA